MIKNKEKYLNSTEMKAVVLFLAKKYFSFLFKQNREDIVLLSENIGFHVGNRMKIQEFSRLTQRLLYRIARLNGYRKNKKNKFKWEKSV